MKLIFSPLSVKADLTLDADKQILYERGDPGNQLFLLVDGTVSISSFSR